ncbi:MAG: hypothetical protein ABSG91_20645, partial [Syntrophobacteraceae bacterium]
ILYEATFTLFSLRSVTFIYEATFTLFSLRSVTFIYEATGMRTDGATRPKKQSSVLYPASCGKILLTHERTFSILP